MTTATSSGKNVDGRRGPAVLQKDGRRRLGLRSVAQRVRFRNRDMYPRRKHALDGGEGTLELTGETGEKLSVFGEAARDERPLAVGSFVAFDEHAKAPFARGISLFLGSDTGAIEGDHHAVRLALVQSSRDRYRTPRGEHGRSEHGKNQTCTHAAYLTARTGRCHLRADRPARRKCANWRVRREETRSRGSLGQKDAPSAR
jgi:hypothetical protein